MSDSYVSTAEAAKAVGVGVTTLLRWVKQRRIQPAAKTPGGQYRWDLDDLRQQLRALAERGGAES